MSLKKSMQKWHSTNKFRGINIKEEPVNSDSWQNAYLFTSHGRYTFMIINAVVKDLLWNGEAENTWSRVRERTTLSKCRRFATIEDHLFPSCGPVCSEVWGQMTNELWHPLWHQHCTSYFRKYLRGEGNSFGDGESFIRLKKPCLHLSMLKFVVRIIKTQLGSSWMDSDRLTDSCILLVLKCRFGSDTIWCHYFRPYKAFCLCDSWLPQGHFTNSSRWGPE